MKNPFRTRYAVTPYRILPDYLCPEGESGIRWTVLRRKWYQRKLYHILEKDAVAIYPKSYKTREEAIRSVTLETIN